MSADIATLSIAVDSSQVRTATRDLGRLESAGAGASGSLGKLVSALGLGLVIRQWFEVNKEFQQLQAQLVTVTGSAQAAQSAFKFLEQFAKDTPFQLNEVVQAFTRLKSVGLDATAQSLQELGDLASANSKNLLDTVQAVTSAAFGEFETLKQYGIVARSLGENVAVTFKGVTTTVRNNAQAISEEVRRISRENFAGGMKRQMDTLGGVWSNLQDQVDAFLRTLGDSGLGAMAIRGLQGVITAFETMQAKIQELATDPAWWEFIGSFEIASRQVVGLTGQILEMGGAVAEAGVRTSFFARIWQGISLLVAGVRDTITAMRNLWGEFFVWLAQKEADMVGFMLSVLGTIPRAVKERLGITDEVEASLTSLQARFQGTTDTLDKMVTEMLANSGSAYEEVLGDIEGVQAEAIKQAQAMKEKLAQIQGSLPGGKGNANQLSAETLQKQAQFIKGLQKEAETLGMTTEQIKLYEAARIGLAGDSRVNAYLRKIREFGNAQYDIQHAFAVGMAAADQYSAAMDKFYDDQEDGIQSAIDHIYPYRSELEQLGKAYEGLVLAQQKGRISTQEFIRGEAELIRQTKALVPVWTDTFGDLLQTLEDWSKRSTDALVELAFTGKAAFTDLINSMLRDLARLAVQKNVTGPLFDLLAAGIRQWATPGAPGGGSATGQNPTSGFGGALPSVVGGPDKGGGSQTSVTINITPSGGVDAQTSGQGGADLFRMIEPGLNQWALKNKRAGGLLAGA